MVLQALARTYKRRRDTVWLAIYVLVILFSGFVVGRMIGSAFSGYSGFKETLRAILDFVPPVELINLAALGVGFYLGLLFLLFLDFKKRIQSLLMIIGTVLGFIIVAIEGVLFPWMSALDYALVAIAFVLSVGAVGGKTLKGIKIDPESLWSGIITNQNNEPVEFQQAAKYLKILVGLFVAVSFFEAHTFYDPLLIMDGTLQINSSAFETFRIEGSDTQAGVDLFFSFLLIFTFTRFLGYEASRRVIFIGPPRSGKTHTIIALYTEAQNSDFNARNPSRFLTGQKDFMTNNRDWAPETEAEVHQMSFVYSTKGLFSKNVAVDGLDYPGEYVYYIARGLEYVNAGMELPSEPVDDELPPSINFGSDELIGEQIEEEFNNSDSWANALIENAYNAPPNSNHPTYEDAYVNHIRTNDPRGATDPADQTASTNPDQVYVHMIRSILPRVMKTDTLAFVFDVNQAIEFKQGDDAKYVAVEEYNNIAATADADRYLGIATKSDLLSDKFEEEMRLRPGDDPEGFQSFIENELLSTPFGDQLENLQLDLYPVYLETEGSSSSNNDQPRIPIKPYGTEKLLHKLGGK